MVREIGMYDMLRYEFFEILLPQMLYTGSEQEQYEVILNLIADGTEYIRKLFRICCEDDGVKYPYEDSDDFKVDMLKIGQENMHMFQIDLPEYNKEINDVIRTYIVFNQRDGEILFKKYFITKWFVTDKQKRILYVDSKGGVFIGEDLTEHMDDLNYERQSVTRDCARALIMDINRMEYAKGKAE